MAKKKAAPSPASIAKQQTAATRKEENKKLKDIYDNAFRKGQHMAMRAAAKQAGLEAGLKAGKKR